MVPQSTEFIELARAQCSKAIRSTSPPVKFSKLLESEFNGFCLVCEKGGSHSFNNFGNLINRSIRESGKFDTHCAGVLVLLSSEASQWN